MKANIGDKIKIVRTCDEYDYFDMEGKTGVVQNILPDGRLLGTWGGMPLLPEDKIEIIEQDCYE